METNKERLDCIEWPCGFRAGDAVIHDDRFAHVASFPADSVPEGQIPIIYDDEGGACALVPIDDLNRRFKRRSK